MKALFLMALAWTSFASAAEFHKCSRVVKVEVMASVKARYSTITFSDGASVKLGSGGADELTHAAQRAVGTNLQFCLTTDGDLSNLLDGNSGTYLTYSLE